MNEPPMIIEMNVFRYREMLRLSMDAQKRLVIGRLLAQAESELKAASSSGGNSAE